MILTKYVKQFVTDKHGKIIIWQMPNLLLWLWIAIKALTLVTSDHLTTSLGHLASAILFAWAYLEITEGESRFRRVLGVVVIAAITIGFFR